MTSPSAIQDSYPHQSEPIWSKSEKAVARTAFDAALKRELHELMQETRRMASQIKEPSDWQRFCATYPPPDVAGCCRLGDNNFLGRFLAEYKAWAMDERP